MRINKNRGPMYKVQYEIKVYVQKNDKYVSSSKMLMNETTKNLYL